MADKKSVLKKIVGRLTGKSSTAGSYGKLRSAMVNKGQQGALMSKKLNIAGKRSDGPTTPMRQALKGAVLGQQQVKPNTGSTLTADKIGARNLVRGDAMIGGRNVKAIREGSYTLPGGMNNSAAVKARVDANRARAKSEWSEATKNPRTPSGAVPKMAPAGGGASLDNAVTPKKQSKPAR